MPYSEYLLLQRYEHFIDRNEFDVAQVVAASSVAVHHAAT